jgi:ferredoxin--NADP+ reductase
VAPDHPKIKSVTRVYEKTAAKPGFRFFGGIELGEHVTRAELLERYHAVVYSMGTADDNRLGIPGEDRPGSYPATRFVAWYNGHPNACDEEFDLSAQRAVVIGNGNVAVDVARMLVLDPDELAPTDTADHAIAALMAAQVEEVVLLGPPRPRAGRVHEPRAARARRAVARRRADRPAELDLDEHSARWLEEEADATSRKNVEILRDYAERPHGAKGHRITLKFLRSPLEILGDGDDGPVTGMRVVKNRIDRAPDGRLRAVATGEEEVLSCGLVLRSIGYRGRPVDDIPFDERRGLIRNDGGRVTDEEGRVLPGEYAAGWIKRGPSGVIGTNKKDAADTTSKIIADRDEGRLNEPVRPGRRGDGRVAGRARARRVLWEGWKAIDEHETRAGEPHGRPRVKLVRLEDLVAAGRGAQV